MKHFTAHASLAGLLTVVLLALGSSKASATLIGTQVTGSMLIPSYSPTMNFFDPANHYVPSGYSNVAGPTVSIADPIKEFGFQNGIDSSNVNFTGSLLTLTGILGNSSAPAIQYRFTSLTHGAFASLVLVSSNLPSLSFSVVGDTLIINEGVLTHNGIYTTVFQINGPATGVPDVGASALLLAVGAGSVFFARRFRTARA